jgi:hypothetical protein
MPLKQYTFRRQRILKVGDLNNTRKNPTAI